LQKRNVACSVLKLKNSSGKNSRKGTRGMVRMLDMRSRESKTFDIPRFDENRRGGMQ